MKLFLKFSVYLLVFVIVLLIAGYFVLTNPSFQKAIIEDQLPQGSSLNEVSISAKKLRFADLIVLLDDGALLKVNSLKATYAPLDAIFNRTIRLGAIDIDGFEILLPQSELKHSAGVNPTIVAPSALNLQKIIGNGASSSGKPAEQGTDQGVSALEENTHENLTEIIYELSRIDWLIYADKLDLRGAFIDGHGNKSQIQITSEAFKPNSNTVITASVKSALDKGTAGDLKSLISENQFTLHQKASGGFDRIKWVSDTLGTSVDSEELFKLGQTVELETDHKKDASTLKTDIKLDLPRPGALFSELEGVGAIQFKAVTDLSTAEDTVALNQAQIRTLLDGNEILVVDSKRAFSLGKALNFEGPLLDLKIVNLPLKVFTPWLPEGYALSGAPINLDLSLSADSKGILLLESPDLLAFGPLSIAQNGQPLADKLSLKLKPRLNFFPDGRVEYLIEALSVSDVYGSFVEGNSAGSIDPNSFSEKDTFAGISAQANLEVGLQELFKIPLLDSLVSVLSGRLTMHLSIDDEAANYPLQITGDIKNFRASSVPLSPKDYRFEVLTELGTQGQWMNQTKFIAGSLQNPSTDLTLFAEFAPDQSPIPFKFDLTGERLSQNDVSLLAAAFSAIEKAPSEVPAGVTPFMRVDTAKPSPEPLQKDKASTQTTASKLAETAVAPPPWASVSGQGSIQIKEVMTEALPLIKDFRAKLAITEAKAELSSLSGKLEKGSFTGAGHVSFDSVEKAPYRTTFDAVFSQLDPSIFRTAKARQLPIRGDFDGSVSVRGNTESFEQVFEDIEIDLQVSGKKGVFTAFELSERKQLGLSIVGLIGQQFDRPGISALSNTIPYFKDIAFDEFALEIKRTQDKTISIPKLKLTGDSLLIDATGLVKGSQLREVLDQPLSLSLNLGAKGTLVRYLESLNLLKANTAEDGFRRWKQDVAITGSLLNPNTDQLMDVLTYAANAALKKPAKPTAIEAETQKQPAQEKRRDEIEMGLDLINSILDF